MKKNKIEGVKPFNDFFFKSCYHQQLIAGIASFGIDRDAILLNSFVLIQNNFDVTKEDFINEKKIEKLLGYKRVHCNINKSKLVRCIDKGQPVIVGIDSYYLESRPDTYQMHHLLHFLLAYGYNLETGEANVIDHRYQNSYEYLEKVISMDNLLEANKRLREGVLKRKHSCYILKRRKDAKAFDIWKYLSEEKIIGNRIHSSENLEHLRKMLTGELNAVRENIEKLTNYVESMKVFYCRLSKTQIFASNQDGLEKITALAGAYSNLLALFWKVKAQNNYDYITKRQENVLRKIDEIEMLEKSVYETLLEAGKCK